MVDASVWVSRFLNTDVFHATSDAWLSRELGAGRTLAGPTLLLAEIAGVIRRETGDAALAEQIAASVELHPQVRLPLSQAMARRAAGRHPEPSRGRRRVRRCRRLAARATRLVGRAAP